MSGNFWSCIEDVKDPFEAQRGGRISLDLLQKKRASSHVEGRISWFFLSCGKKVGVPLELQQGPQDPLELPQESQVSMRVARGLSGFLSSLYRDLGPHLHIEARTSPFLYSADMDLLVPM